jgi:hypothetical protein
MENTYIFPPTLQLQKSSALSMADDAKICRDTTNTKDSYPEEVMADDGCPNC